MRAYGGCCGDPQRSLWAQPPMSQAVMSQGDSPVQVAGESRLSAVMGSTFFVGFPEPKTATVPQQNGEREHESQHGSESERECHARGFEPDRPQSTPTQKAPASNTMGVKPDNLHPNESHESTSPQSRTR